MQVLDQAGLVVHTDPDRVRLCDVCKQQIRSKDSSEVTIESKIGDAFEGDDYREHRRIDCCVSCFTGKVRPLLEQTLGVVFYEPEPSTARTLTRAEAQALVDAGGE